MQREVVITGIGLVSPIGIGRQQFWGSLREGRSGVRTIANFDPTNLPAPFGGEIPDFDAKLYVRPRKSLKVMSWDIQLGFAAADMAYNDAELRPESIDPERLGVVFGSDLIYGDLAELAPPYRNCVVDGRFDYARWGTQVMQDLFPLWMLKYLPNMPACHIGIAHDSRGPNNSIVLGEVSSLVAIAEAARVIERGHADVMITGGTGSRLNITGLAYRGHHWLSRREECPEAASRPFDADRDGMVNGEGSGAFILEELRHAEGRGAMILGRILGHASSFEPRVKGRPPQGTAIRSAIGGALKSAGLQPSDLGHVNAHGLSTVEHDRAEAQAIHDTLGDVPVTAPKSFFGNAGPGGGAIEMAASVLAFGAGEVPKTLNYERPDSACPINVIHGSPAPLGKPVAMILSQATMGQAAAMVIAGP